MAESPTVVAPGFDWRVTAAGRVLVSSALEALAPHLFTSRSPVRGEAPDAPDYGAVGSVLGVPAARVVRVRQVHGRAVQVVRRADDHTDATIGSADAVVSLTPDCAVSVRIADCVPTLIADRGQRVVAAVHGGWRGTAAGIAAAAVQAIGELGIPAGDLVAAIGPAIGPCCYQVDEAVRDAFRTTEPGCDPWFAGDGKGRWRLDLPMATRDQLEAAGVPATSIGLSGACTAHQADAWYSFRREGAAAGRMVAAIRLAGERR